MVDNTQQENRDGRRRGFDRRDKATIADEVKTEQSQSISDNTFDVSGSINGGNVNLGGNQQIENLIIGDSQVIYNQVSARVLVKRQVDPTEDGQIVLPSNVSVLVNKIIETHIAVIYFPLKWESTHLINILANEITTAAKIDVQCIYEQRKATNAETVIYEVKRFEDEAESDEGLSKGVILLDDVVVEGYPFNRLRELQELGRKRNLYFIITTGMVQRYWGHHGFDDMLPFIQVYDYKPYTATDLTTQFMRSVEQQSDEMKSHLQSIGLLNDPEQIDPETVIRGLDRTIEAVATSFDTPHEVNRLLTKLLKINDPTEAEAVYQEVQSQAEDPVQTWFGELSESEQLIAISVVLFNGLSQDTFWAVYELLVGHVWRERDTQLKMADYQETLVSLTEWIRFDQDANSRVEMESHVQARLLDEILNTYRRTVIQALPFLAYLLTYPERTTVFGEQPLIDELRALNIFGSQYDSTLLLYSRREQLNNRIIDSIVQVRHREPNMADHLLLVWATGNRKESDQSTLNRRLRQLFSQTILSLYQSEGVEADNMTWFSKRSSFRLLADWYTRYTASVGLSTTAQVQAVAHGSDENARTRIRIALADALVEFGRWTPEEDFVQGQRDVDITALRKMPGFSLTMNEIQSPWHMLVAMAWDPAPLVRMHVARRVADLYATHPAKTEALVAILASDFNPDVRLVLATTLASVTQNTPSMLYLVYDLLDQQTSPVNRKFDATQQRQHYLWVNTEQNMLSSSKVLPQHWTATMAMFWIGRSDPALFRLYQQTYLDDRNRRLFQAFQEVLSLVMNTNPLWRVFRDTVLHEIVVDSREGNRMSYTAAELLDSHGFRVHLNKQERETLSQLGPVSKG